MKKFISLILSLTMILGISSCGNAADILENTDFTLKMQIDNPVMTINGTEQNIDNEGTTPVIVNDRTLVPIRAIIEAMGGTVGWEQSTQTATLNYGDDEIQLVIDSETAYLNGAANTLDVAPTIINDRTMLPIRFISESFKFGVDWEQETQTVIITKSGTISDTVVTSPSENGTGKTLVVYYSATGNTETAANYIAKATNADIFELVPSVPYTDDDLDWTDENSRVTREHDNENERDVELVSATVDNWDSYDTVFIGYPIWWGIAAWVVDGFVEANDFTGKTVIPFCTSASSPLGESGELLAQMAGEGNWLEGKRFSGRPSENEVTEWTNEILSSIENNPDTSSDNKTLIAYFSRAVENYDVGVIEVGNTAVIAGYINDAVDADVFEIVAKEPYPVGYEDTKTRVQQEMAENARPEFVGEVANMEQYDTIYIGYPIWYGTMPMIMSTFLEKYDMSGKTIIPFSTHEGSGWGSSLTDLKELCPNSIFLDGYSTRGRNAVNAESEVREWIDGLKGVFH